jgi:hypothetical protein
MKHPVNRQISTHPCSHDEKATMTEISMSEDIVVNDNLLKYAKWSVMGVIILTVGQSATGLGQVTTSLSLGASHTYAAQIGLLLSVAVVVLIIASKTQDKKIKGMAFGLATMWLIQYGLGEMFTVSQLMPLIHAPLALMIFAHGLALFKSLPSV